MNVIDLFFDDLEHVASLRRRSQMTSRPFWTGRAARPLDPRATSGSGWPARTTLASLITHRRRLLCVTGQLNRCEKRLSSGASVSSRPYAARCAWRPATCFGLLAQSPAPVRWLAWRVRAGRRYGGAIFRESGRCERCAFLCRGSWSYGDASKFYARLRSQRLLKNLAIAASSTWGKSRSCSATSETPD
jgi:hypothetical protein